MNDNRQYNYSKRVCTPIMLFNNNIPLGTIMNVHVSTCRKSSMWSDKKSIFKRIHRRITHHLFLSETTFCRIGTNTRFKRNR